MKKKVKILGLIGLLIVAGLFGLRLIDKPATTTSKDFLNLFQVSQPTYLNDKLQVIKTVDSLLSLHVKYKSAEKALRFFDGKTYEDTVDRQWAIDLPMKGIRYIEHHVDTIFYNPHDQNMFAGILISKTTHRLARNGIEYVGNGFVCKRNGQILQLAINGYRVTGSGTIEECTDAIHGIYFREMGLVDSSFNLNGKRFWASNDLIKIKWD